MLNLLRSDFFKLFKNKAFRVCIILCFGMMLVSALSQIWSANIFSNLSPEALTEFSNRLNQSGPGFQFGLSNNTAALNEQIEKLENYSAFNFVTDAFISNTTPILSAIFISLFISSEFKNGTLRNIISKGFSRQSIYLSKLITVVCSAFILILCTLLSAGLIGIVFFGAVPLTLPDTIGFLYRLLMQMFLHIGLASLFMMIIICLKHTGPAIALNICLLIIVTSFLSITMSIKDTGFNLVTLWIGEAIHQLNFDNYNPLVFTQVLILTVCYTVFPTFVGLSIFKRRDIM